MGTKRNSTVTVGLLIVGLALSGCAAGNAGAISAENTAGDAAPAPVPALGRATAMEIFLSSTKADWQAEADALVVAHVSSERRHPKPDREAYLGTNGFDMVGRTITLDIQRVVWVDPAREGLLGERLSMVASGWFDNGQESVEMVVGSGARLEVGHDYVLALRWYPERHDPTGDDPTVPASWGVLGSDAKLPVDGGVIGRGEYEGELTRGLTASEVPKGSLLADNLGTSLDDFIASMADFTRVERDS